ncbi:cytochrome c3 family protein [Marinobacter sp.]|uniref:cytochrome c3 family protein n=1 Tax=Marinobacter sp. TaxID=50741 RepID=UPI002B4AA572|nr:cytochrome c3 family protein [Marinobacter sp.]HKK55673.1 cytochrome c3 family protein [Marinobacter sp.]
MLLIALITAGCQGGGMRDQSADSSLAARVELPPGVSETQHAGDFGSHYDARQPGDLELQRPSQALSDFPRTRLGEVDWVIAMEKGLINPRKGLQEDAEMEVLDLDVIMPRVRGMPEVLFSHKVHTEWLGCESCHDQLFAKKAGAHRATMNDIFAGKSCGTCHDRVAFSTYTCDRCHSVVPGKD